MLFFNNPVQYLREFDFCRDLSTNAIYLNKNKFQNSSLLKTMTGFFLASEPNYELVEKQPSLEEIMNAYVGLLCKTQKMKLRKHEPLLFKVKSILQYQILGDVNNQFSGFLMNSQENRVNFDYLSFFSINERVLGLLSSVQHLTLSVGLVSPSNDFQDQ